MASTNLDDAFLAIWLRARNQPSLDNLTPSLVGAWATERHLTVEEVEERAVGAFETTRSIVLKVNGGRACFPKVAPEGDPAWQKRRHGADQTAAIWEKMEWFSPLWVANGELQALLKAVAESPKERAIQLFDYHTSTFYTLSFQAVCIAQILPRAHSLLEFCPLAREAYLAFYSGYRASSIAALIPAIEGALSRIVSDAEANLTMPDKVDRAVSRAIERAARMHFENMWIPMQYLTTEYLLGQDERVFIFETFRRWLRSSFFWAPQQNLWVPHAGSGRCPIS
jgi:hypothetical protein